MPDVLFVDSGEIQILEVGQPGPPGPAGQSVVGPPGPPGEVTNTSLAATVKTVHHSRLLSTLEQPAGEQVWDWMHGPDEVLDAKMSPGGLVYRAWGSRKAERYKGALVFSRARDGSGNLLYPPYVADNQSFLLDNRQQPVQWVAGLVSFTPGNGLTGSSQRCVLIAASGGGFPHGDPSLANLSVQGVITPQSAGLFYYDASRIPVSGYGQIWLGRDGTPDAGLEISGETTYASLGLPNLAEDYNLDTGEGTIYRVAMGIDWLASRVTLVLDDFAVWTFTHPKLKQIWHNRGTLLSWQEVRHTGCGDPVFRAIGYAKASRHSAPTERLSTTRAYLKTAGAADPSGSVSCPAPAWKPAGDLEWLIDCEPDVPNTGSLQAIGPSQWDPDSQTFHASLSDSGSVKFVVGWSNDGITARKIESPAFTWDPAKKYHLVYRTGTAPYTGAPGSGTSPASLELYSSPDRITLTLIGTVYAASGQGGVPAQRGSAAGANTDPPRLVIAARDTKGREAFAGKIRVAQLFAAGGLGESVTGPVTGFPLVAGRDWTGTWTAVYNIASTAAGTPDPDGTPRTVITLASPLKSAVLNGTVGVVGGVAGAGAVNTAGHWALVPVDATHVTIPVTSTGAGTGGTLSISYTTGSGVDPAGNPWTPDGSAVFETETQADLDSHTVQGSSAHGGLEQSTNKGQPNGYASLDSGGKVPSAQLPSLAINDTFVVASEAAMLALAADQGDIAVRTDLTPRETFILQGADPTVLANWVQISSGGEVASVNGMTGVVTGLAADTAVVHLAGDETIDGTKTFLDAPVVPDGSFTEAKVNGLTGDLAAKAAAVHTHAESDVGSLSTDLANLATDVAARVQKSLYDANTILKADTDDTPAALPVGASTVVGRKATGGIAALTMADLKALLALVAADTSDFSEAVDDRLGSLLQAGSSISLTYNDAAGTLTIAVSAITAANHGAGYLPDAHHAQYHADSDHTGANKVDLALNDTLKARQPKVNLVGGDGARAFEDASNGRADLWIPSEFHYRPSFAVVQNLGWGRRSTDNSTGPASGREMHAAIWLPKGLPVNGVGMLAGAAQAASGLSHWLMGLRDSSNNLLRGSVDDTTTATIAASSTSALSRIEKNLSSQFTTTYNGWHYVTLLLVGTPASLQSASVLNIATSNADPKLSFNGIGLQTTLAGTSSVSQSVSHWPYCYVY